MKPQSLVKMLFISLFISGVFSSCTKTNTDIYRYPGPGNAPAAIHLYLTATSSSFQYSNVNVSLAKLEYNTSNDPGITEGWETVNLEAHGVIDMMPLVNGGYIRLNSDMIPGSVRQLRVVFGDNNTVETDGAIKPLKLAQELKESGVVIFTDATLNGRYSTSLWINFDATHSIVFDANTDEYLLVPVISSFDESTTGAIEGTVSPSDAKATIHIHSDQNSRNILLNTTAVADANNGYFRFVGLPEGTYQVDIIAGDGTQRSKTITTIEVKAGTTQDLGLNILE